jgi:multidrug resistance efflux pump
MIWCQNMWMKIPSIIFKKNVNQVLLIVFFLSLGQPWLFQAAAQQAPDTKAAASQDIILSGKLSCSVKRTVIVPFLGVITSLPVRTGQKVAKGELLAKYLLSPESVLALRSRIYPSQIKNLELTQTTLADKLDELQRQQQGLQQLAANKMASRQNLETVEDQINAICRQSHANTEQLDFARKLHQDDIRLLQKQLGIQGPIRNLPSEGRLTAPLNGYVIWINPDVRLGAELKQAVPAFIIAALDPMIVSAQVHELDAMRLRLGEQAEVEAASVPGKKFTAHITRISWSSLSSPDQPSFFEVQFSVSNPDHILKDGLRVQITVPKAAAS